MFNFKMVHKDMLWSEKTNNTIGRKTSTWGKYRLWLDLTLKAHDSLGRAGMIFIPWSLNNNILSASCFLNLQHEGPKLRNVSDLTLHVPTIKIFWIVFRTELCSEYCNSNNTKHLWEFILWKIKHYLYCLI